MEKKISVIVPVYNVDSYLNKCVDSILNQTYDNLELFLVDDGSTDDSPKICDEYAKADERVHVIHKENGGQSSARNMALDKATGDYIAFVDADDWLDINMYKQLYECLINNDVDVSCCPCYKVIDGVTSCPDVINEGQIIIYDNTGDFFYHIFGGTPLLRPECWNKLYKREIIGNIRFKDRQIHQDVYFARMVFHNAKKVAYIDLPLYYYLESRPGSTNSKAFNENRFPFFNEMKDLSDQLREADYIKGAEQVEIFAMKRAIYFYIYGANSTICREFYNRFSNFYHKVSYATVIKNPKILLFKLAPNIYKKIALMRIRN